MSKRILTLAILSLGISTPTAFAKPLSEARARMAIAPFYDAFTVAANKDAAALVLKGTANDWQSCSAEDVCVPREQAAKAIAGFGHVIPDLRWIIKEVIVSGNRVTVRGEGTGTPSQDFMGVPYSGKSFKLMSIDVHHIKNGKISGRSYHIEDWSGAMRQLSAQ